MSGALSPEVVERVKMALADCGFDPASVYATGKYLRFDSLQIPREVIWRAREIAIADTSVRPLCQKCAEAAMRAWRSTSRSSQVDAIRESCEAAQVLLRDCGVAS